MPLVTKSCVVVTSWIGLQPVRRPVLELDGHAFGVVLACIRTMHGVSHRRRRLSSGAGSKVNASATPVGYRSVPRLVCEWLRPFHDLTSYVPATCSKKQPENSIKTSCGRLTHVHLTICEIEHIAAQELLLSSPPSDRSPHRNPISHLPRRNCRAAVSTLTTVDTFLVSDGR